jgi:amino acid transporter
VKVVLVAFLILTSLALFQASNLSPFLPAQRKVSGNWQFGVDGMFQGTVQSFFCFIGFDEVCCMAGQARDPKRDMPRAIMLSVLGTAVLTGLAAFGLVGMVKYTDMNPDAAFESGFDQHNLHWAAQIASWGELITLPVVVYISILPQANLFYAMSMDGLLPKVFTKLTDRKVLLKGNIIIGIFGAFMSTLLDFNTIADLTSAGVLLSFILCNASFIMLTLTRSDSGGSLNASQVQAPQAAFSLGASVVSVSPENQRLRKQAGVALSIYCVAGFACMLILTGLLLPSTLLGSLHTAPDGVKVLIVVIIALLGVITLSSLAVLAVKPYSKEYGSIWMPAAGIMFNCFMLSTLSKEGFFQFALAFIAVIVYYFSYGIRKSAGNSEGWQRKSFLPELETNCLAAQSGNQHEPETSTSTG